MGCSWKGPVWIERQVEIDSHKWSWSILPHYVFVLLIFMIVVFTLINWLFEDKYGGPRMFRETLALPLYGLEIGENTHDNTLKHMIW